MRDDTSAPPLHPPRLTRRRLLAGAAATGAALLVAPGALAARGSERSKIRDIYRGKRGTTIWLDLETAPYPDGKAPYTDPTVIVFVPHYYRVKSDYEVDTIIHLHGYRDTAEDAMKRHQLREQLHDSKQNAIIVFPQGPVRAEDPRFGKLDRKDGLLRFLTELRKTLQEPRVSAQLGAAGIPRRARIGKVIMTAHSGGFGGVASCLQHGGYNVNEVYLFDALYGRTGIFRDWIKDTYFSRGPDEARHKLISYYGDEPTRIESRRLMRELERLKIAYAHEEKEGELSRRDLVNSRAVFIRMGVGHQGVTFRTNALRDCLFASCLDRFLTSKWFSDVDQPRDINRRQ